MRIHQLPRNMYIDVRITFYSQPFILRVVIEWPSSYGHHMARLIVDILPRSHRTTNTSHKNNMSRYYICYTKHTNINNIIYTQ